MNASQERWFDHEKLQAYREAIAFIAWLVRVKSVSKELSECSWG